MGLTSADSGRPEAAGPTLAQSVDNEGFHIRIIFKDGVITGRDPCGILDSAAQLKTDIVFALPANREPLFLQQGSLMH